MHFRQSYKEKVCSLDSQVILKASVVIRRVTSRCHCGVGSQKGFRVVLPRGILLELTCFQGSYALNISYSVFTERHAAFRFSKNRWCSNGHNLLVLFFGLFCIFNSAVM